MSRNHYTSYYLNQAGTGLSGFQGTNFQWNDQQGEGFLDVIKSIGMPILKYLGRKAISTGINVAQDALSGDNLIQSTKRNLKRTAQDIAGDAGDRAIRFAQTGTGKRRQRMKNSKRETNSKKRRAVLKPKKERRTKRKTETKRKRKRRRNKVKVNTIFD